MKRMYYKIVDNNGKVISIHYKKDIAERELEILEAIADENFQCCRFRIVNACQNG